MIVLFVVGLLWVVLFMMFLKILALVKVVDEFDLKILANLVNILNNDDTKVRALRASVTRTIWAAYGYTQQLAPITAALYINTIQQTNKQTIELITTRDFTGQITTLVTRQTYRFSCSWIFYIENVFNS